MTVAVIMLLLTRLPFYVYAAHRAWVLRHEVIVISPVWLLILALASFMIAIASAFGDPLLSQFMGYLAAVSVFGIAYTAKPIKIRTEEK